MRQKLLKTVFLGVAVFGMAGTASATEFNIPGGDLKSALDAYAAQSGVQLIVSSDVIKGVQTKGAKGDLSPDVALIRILNDTGLSARHHTGGAVAIIPERASSSRGLDALPILEAQAAPARASVETVTVTSSKLGGADVQSIPIAITALSQEQLTATQTAGGPDLIKQVPNMTFTKTNFSGYSIQLRGIGTQAISVTTDPAVAVAFNDTPFIRNHFFEQEFYDVAQVAVLRGPQGTLYGRNATAGVVNLTSAKPTDQFEAMASGELGNYHQRRFEGMINIPIVDDWLDMRVAGEWTKRQGYSFNALTDQRIDGRDLWSGRLSIAWRPIQSLQTTLVWEHFSEDDDRIRSSKQLCKRDPGPSEVNGVHVPQANEVDPHGVGIVFYFGVAYVSQGCLPTSLYSADAFEVPNGYSLPYWSGPSFDGAMTGVDPYVSTTQSQNLRVIESSLDPIYKVKNDIFELNTDYAMTPSLTLTSQTGFSHDFLYATQDYNRFNTSPGVFVPGYKTVSPTGVFCDPQLGCSDRLVAQDLSTEHAWQLNQELRMTSNFSGPFNFSMGGNYLHYETEENYYVFINSLTLFSLRAPPDNARCLSRGFTYSDPAEGGGEPTFGNWCPYIDPNPIASLNDHGHNYFLSQNPYVLSSYATFGEANYNLTNTVKLTAGLRWTEDRKHFSLIPSWVIGSGWGYPVAGVVDQQWDQFTGRAVVNWTPKLDFTDQTLAYGSFAHGYKAGGANPPGAVLVAAGGSDQTNPVHPLTFKPEFIDAFEVGTKNTLLDGALTFNLSAFYYNYENYQISEIVDRTSINLNFDAHVKGAEIETTWEPIPGLRLNFSGGWEDTALARGEKAVDLIDRADVANHPDWMVVKPFATQASNCILPLYVVSGLLHYPGQEFSPAVFACGNAYSGVRGVGTPLDPVTCQPYGPDPTTDCFGGDISSLGLSNYPGFDSSTAPNNGQGFDKDLSGHELPNAPPFTVSFGGQYSIPLTTDWAGTLRGDFYWQDNSWARVFNDDPYDRIRGYKTFNLTLIFTSQSGWQVMLFDKNVFNTTAITGTFLNSDDSGLTTNVFLTDPKLIGIRVTKNW